MSRRSGQPPGVDWEDAYHNLDNRLRQLQQNYNAKEEAIKQLKVALRKVGDHRILEVAEEALQRVDVGAVSSSSSRGNTNGGVTRSSGRTPPKRLVAGGGGGRAGGGGGGGTGALLRTSQVEGRRGGERRGVAMVPRTGRGTFSSSFAPGDEENDDEGGGGGGEAVLFRVDQRGQWADSSRSHHQFDGHLVEPVTTTTTTSTITSTSTTNTRDTSVTAEGVDVGDDGAVAVAHRPRPSASASASASAAWAAERAPGGLLPDPAMIWGAQEAHERLERMAQALYHANEELRRELNESSSKVQGLEQELAAARAAFVGKESAVSALRDELYRVVRERDAAVVAQRGAQAEVSGLEGTIADRTAELSSLRTRLVAGADHNELLRQELRQLADAVQEKTAEAASMRSQLSVAQAALSSQRHTNEQLLAELKSQHEQLVTERKKVIQLAREVQVHSLAQQRTMDLEQQVRRLQEERVRADGEHLQLMRAFSTVSEEVMAQAREALSAELETARSSAAHWEEAAKRLYKDIAARVEEHQQCRQDCEAARKARDELTAQLRQTREELSLCLAKLSVAWPQHHRVTSHLPTAELETLMRATAAQQALKDEAMTTGSHDDRDLHTATATTSASADSPELGALESVLAALSCSNTGGGERRRPDARPPSPPSFGKKAHTLALVEKLSSVEQREIGAATTEPASRATGKHVLPPTTPDTTPDPDHGFLSSALDTFLKDLPADPTTTAEKLWELSEANAGLCAEMEQLQLSNDVLMAHVETVKRQKEETALAVAAVEAREAAGQARLAAEMDRVMFLEKQIHALRGYAVSPLRAMEPSTTTTTIESDDSGSVSGMENVLELFLGQLVSYAPRPTQAATLLPYSSTMGGASHTACYYSDTFFCTADFLLHETIMTPTIVGLSGFLDTTAAYRIRMDALLLYYLATRELVVQLHRVRDDEEVFRRCRALHDGGASEGSQQEQQEECHENDDGVNHKQQQQQQRQKWSSSNSGKADSEGNRTDSELAVMESMYETVAEGRVRLLDLVLDEQSLHAEHPTLRGHIHLYRLHSRGTSNNNNNNNNNRKNNNKTTAKELDGENEVHGRVEHSEMRAETEEDEEKDVAAWRIKEDHVASVEFRVSARVPFSAAFRALVRETAEDAAEDAVSREENDPQPPPHSPGPSVSVSGRQGGRDTHQPHRSSGTVYSWLRRSSSSARSLSREATAWKHSPESKKGASLARQRHKEGKSAAWGWWRRQQQQQQQHSGNDRSGETEGAETEGDTILFPRRQADHSPPAVPTYSHLPLLAHHARQAGHPFPPADSLTTTTTTKSSSSSSSSSPPLHSLPHDRPSRSRTATDAATALQKRLEEAHRWQRGSSSSPHPTGPTPLRPRPAPAPPPPPQPSSSHECPSRPASHSPPPQQPRWPFYAGSGSHYVPEEAGATLNAAPSLGILLGEGRAATAAAAASGAGRRWPSFHDPASATFEMTGGAIGAGGFQFLSIDIFRVELPADLPAPVPRLACFYELRALQREVRLPAPPTSRYTIVYPQNDGEAGTCFAIRDAAERFALRREPLTLFFLNVDHTGAHHTTTEAAMDPDEGERGGGGEEEGVVWGMAVCELHMVLDNAGRTHCFDLPILGADNVVVEGALVRVRLQASPLPSFTQPIDHDKRWELGPSHNTSSVFFSPPSPYDPSTRYSRAPVESTGIGWGGPHYGHNTLSEVNNPAREQQEEVTEEEEGKSTRQKCQVAVPAGPGGGEAGAPAPMEGHQPPPCRSAPSVTVSPPLLAGVSPAVAGSMTSITRTAGPQPEPGLRSPPPLHAPTSHPSTGATATLGTTPPSPPPPPPLPPPMTTATNRMEEKLLRLELQRGMGRR